ncbi:MAG: LytTR family DNA-binding domain-containing protein [Bacteroidales bacterium]|nr:LytTR family DNA-binding domain-containing protein [Bacteroidales bacterium]NCA74822.1 response regulator transcription factor [Alphaproteobacteria bacterium]HNW72676.1 LytTR family DNA-binding domain-containing protein [Bacteroidales bacterium]HPS49212.1 LytTR family DNA-binding domain-containing protein [Bacteroidales bacterium]
MKINCIAIDDEPLALDIIKDYCSKVVFLNLLKTFDNAIESIEFIRSNKVDLIFLDIQMEELTGIQLLNALKHRPLVIFTTAYEHYAIQGFELDVIDYMLKPISFERFIKGVNKVCEKMQLDSSQNKNETLKTSQPEAQFFFVKTETRMEKIENQDVLYVEGMGDYWRIVTKNRRIMTLMNAKKLEEVLHEPQFCRVHKSFFVALDKIESIERNRIKISDKYIPVSETYHKNFFDLIERKKLA